MEMEIRHSYTEVRSMLEGVLLHIFRGLKGTYLLHYFFSRSYIRQLAQALLAGSKSSGSLLLGPLQLSPCAIDLKK